MATFYLEHGCWNLALALHEATGLPIELFYGGGRPRHAYVVDGDTALDACGRRLIRHARAGADETREITPEEMLESLAAIEHVGALLVTDIDAEDVREAARRTALYLLEIVGWKPS